MATDSDSGKIAVFGYGSNSTAQLRARVENPTLCTRPARLEGFERVFVFASAGWGGGGVASIAPLKGATVLGSVALLTAEEKRRLDAYEMGYREETVTALLGASGETPLQPLKCTAYVAGPAPTDAAPAYTPPMQEEPSEQYLVAIHLHLREHWGKTPDTMDQLEVGIWQCQADGDLTKVSEWAHPGVSELSLEAICVEINGHKEEPWKMPKAIPEVVATLKRVGIHRASDLGAATAPLPRAEWKVGTLNARLDAAGAEPFDDDTIDALRSLRIHRVLVYGALMSELESFHIMQGGELLDIWAFTQQADFVLVVNDLAAACAGEFCFPMAMRAVDRRADCTPTKVVGEVYGLSAGMLEELDEMEDHPGRNKRQLVEVENHSAPAWLYALHDAEAVEEVKRNEGGQFDEVKPGGDWRRYKEMKGARALYPELFGGGKRIM